MTGQWPSTFCPFQQLLTAASQAAELCPASSNLSWKECVNISRNCAPVQCSKQTPSIQNAPVLRKHTEYQCILT